ncbi:MAG: hypothetical protein E4H14_10140 [Candidatus Thorarchaeota archaeon]|nr:MAG: hypothetical protein E4H14_10140 [Candidatus Thorarchaeota archaeon]
MTNCPICGRDKQDQFCSYHQTAFDNLKKMHTTWENAAGLSWEDYLDKISDLENTGRWIREVIEFITQQDGL